MLTGFSELAAMLVEKNVAVLACVADGGERCRGGWLIVADHDDGLVDPEHVAAVSATSYSCGPPVSYWIGVSPGLRGRRAQPGIR